MNSTTPNTWKNISRHENTFNDLLYEQLRKTPWRLLSVACHAVLILLLFTMGFSSGAPRVDARLNSRVEEEVIEPLREEVKPDMLESKPIEQEESNVVQDPVIKDAKVSDHNETDDDQPCEESLGNEDFISGAPFDGPSTNAAIGIGGGAGGSFGGRGGHRDLRAEGGGASTESAVDHGLDWMKNHQDPDGYWDSDGFMTRCKGDLCTGAGYSLYDPGVSGLAVLAFLGAGETHKHGTFRKTVVAGLKYLNQAQDPEGCFGPRTTSHFTYNLAIETLAMAEAYGLTGSPLFKSSAQNGLDFALKCQNPYLARRYGVRPGDNDSSVTGWMVMALKSARSAGLRVDESGFQGASAWIDKVTEPEYGRVGYTHRGSGPARPTDLMDRFPSDKSESLTAVGLLSRIFCGEDPQKSVPIQQGVALCMKALPLWDEQAGVIDIYYWYYGTLALFRVGGEAWKNWNKAIRTAVIDQQRQDGCAKGSWDPSGPWGRDGGRICGVTTSTPPSFASCAWRSTTAMDASSASIDRSRTGGQS